jgi:hypothetical protein
MGGIVTTRYTPSGGAAAPIAPIEEDEDLYLAPTEPPPRPSLEVAAPAAEDEDLYLAPAATPVVNEGMYAADGTLKRAPKSKKASKKASTKASATGAGAGVGAGAASTKKKKKASTKPKQAEKHPDGADNAYASFTLPRGADTATAAGGAGTNATESTKKKASTKKSKKKSTKSKANDEEEEVRSPQVVLD